MSQKTKKLVLQEGAPNEVQISYGTQYKRHFKRADAPFTVEAKYADMLLRARPETFAEFVETPAKKGEISETPTKETKK